MLKGSGWKKGQECAHSWLKNHPLGFIGRGKILAQLLWPGMEARLRKSNGQLESTSTNAVDVDGTYLDRDGIVRKAILNRLRFGRNGGLFEGARTQLFSQVQNFPNSYWAKSAASVTADQAIAPDGTTAADKCIPDTSGSAHYVQRSISFDGVSSYILYVFAKAAELDAFGLVLPAQAFPSAPSCSFNLTAKAATPVASTGGIEELINGWFLCWMKATSDISTSSLARMRLFPTAGNNGTDGIYLWGAGLEIGGFAASPIIVNLATRAAEDIRYDNTGEAIAKAAQGTVVVRIVPEFTGTDNPSTIEFLNCLTADDGIALQSHWSTDKYRLIVKSGGVWNAQIDASIGAVRGTAHVLAVSWKLNEFTLYVAGIQEAQDTAGLAPAAMHTSLFVGQSAAGGSQHFGNIGPLVITDPALSVRQVENATAVIRRAA